MSRGRSGFTLLELMIAVVVVALIAVNVSMVLKTGSTAYEAELLQSELDDQSSLAIDRIRLALMSSSLDQLNPELNEGLHTSDISYRISLGLDEDDVLVLDDPEEIQLDQGSGSIVWRKLPAGGDERSVVWTRDVPGLLKGEIPNGDDDNQNGLADEEGLVFKREGENVRVQLSVERSDARGVLYTSPVRSEVVFCRN